VKEFFESISEQFQDAEFRNAYADAFLNSRIAAQIKIIREQRDLTQAALAEKIGTKQAGISRLENINYSSWRVDTLLRLARAFDVRLRISFEEFGTLLDEVDHFGRASLQRAAFDDDPKFRVTDEATIQPILSNYEKSVLSASESNVLSFSSKAYNNPFIGEQNASPIDSSGASRSLYGTGGAEFEGQGVLSRHRPKHRRAIPIHLEQQQGQR
jgi:transcriptional regulator with XRE-family HTH domain